jgi:hypothetical protein
MPQQPPQENDGLFPLQVLLKEGTNIHVTHFPATLSPLEKLRAITTLYQELLVPTGSTQGSEQISTQESDEEESYEEQDAKRLFAQEFVTYAEQVGAKAMALLLHDRRSLLFISTHPDAASQHREDMLTALRRRYPHLSEKRSKRGSGK